MDDRRGLEPLASGFQPGRPRRIGSWVGLVLLWWAARAATQRLLHFDAHESWLAIAGGYSLDALWVTTLWAVCARSPRLAWAVGTLFALRLLDLWAVLWTGVHMGPVVWFHLDARMWRVAIEQGAPIVVGGGAGLAWMVTRLARRAPSRSEVSWPVSLLLAVIIGHSVFVPSGAGGLAGLAELGVVRSWAAHHLPLSAQSRPVSAEQLARWSRYGWLKRQPRASVEPPLSGLVVIFMESSASAATQVYEPKAALKSPGLASVAAVGVKVRGYRAQASPTHAGLLTSLCGMLPSAWPLTAAATEPLPTLPNCLPKLVRGAGGATVFMQGSPLSFTGLDRLASAMGFDEARGLDELGTPGRRDTGPWGLYDDALYDAALRRLRELANAQRPFLLVVSTTDGHLPGTIPPGCAPPQLNSRYLAAQHCADASLERFVSRVRAEPRFAQVGVVVTADHAPPRVADVAAALPGRPHFARIPLIIDDRSGRQREIKVVGGQIDLMATLSPLLGVSVSRGRDLLGSAAPPERVLLARSDRGVVGIGVGESWRELPRGALERECHRSQFTSVMCDIVAYLDALDAWWFSDALSRYL